MASASSLRLSLSRYACLFGGPAAPLRRLLSLVHQLKFKIELYLIKYKIYKSRLY